MPVAHTVYRAIIYHETGRVGAGFEILPHPHEHPRGLASGFGWVRHVHVFSLTLITTILPRYIQSQCLRKAFSVS